MKIWYSRLWLIGLIWFWGNHAYSSEFSWGEPNLPSKSVYLKTPPSVKSPPGQEAYARLRDFADTSNVWGVENNIDETKKGLPSAVIVVSQNKQTKETQIISLFPNANGRVDEVEINPNFPGSRSSSGKIVALDIWQDGKIFPGRPEFFVNREDKRHEWYTLYQSEDGLHYKQMFEYVNHKAKSGEVKTIYAGLKLENELSVSVAKEDARTSESVKLTLDSGFRVLLAIPEAHPNPDSSTTAKRLIVYAIRKDPATSKEVMTKFVYEIEKGPKLNQIIKEVVSESTIESFRVSKKSYQPEVPKESSQPSTTDGSK